MNWVSTAQLDRYRSHFPGTHLEMVLASIVAGNTAACLWEKSQAGASPLLLLWDKGNNVLYLAGDSCDDSSFASLAEMVSAEIRVQARAEARPHFKMHALSPSLHAGMSEIFPDMALNPVPTLFFLYDAAQNATVAPPTLPNVVLRPITPNTLSSGIAYSEHVLEEIRQMWPSEDRFFQHGFGSVAIMGNEIICWCTAEYASPARCGIGIATSPRYERHGVATATACHFVQEALRRGVAPCWECSRANVGSIRVAEKVGFVLATEETYWRGSFAD